jgi:Na+/melibiose symporter-like transporter
VVGKSIPPERRGEFFAWRMGLGGVLGIGASAVVRWVLDPNGPLVFPYNFGVLSVIFLVLGASSIFAFNGLREPYEEHTLPAQNLPGQAKRAMEVVRTQPKYRRFLAMMSVMILSSSATPFFAVYVQRVLGGSQAMIGYYLAIQTTANLLSTVMFGRVSRRYGNGAVMALGLCSGIGMVGLVVALVLLAGITPLSGAIGAAWLLPVFMLAGIRNSGTGIAWNSLLLDIAPPEERSLYVGFTNTILGVVLLLTGMSGMIVKVLGYNALFAFALSAHVLALWLGLGVMKASRLSTSESLDAAV